MDVFSGNQTKVIESLVQQLHLSMDLLDDDVAHEYREAVKRAPDLVKRESNGVHFLRTDDWHVLRAAQRLAGYWKLRKHLFGEACWLLPMTQTGTGALNMQDIEILRSGYLIGYDSTWVFDLSRVPKGSGFHFPRVIFYISTAYADTLSRHPGIHFVWSVHGPDCVPDETQFNTRLKLRECCAIRVESLCVAVNYGHRNAEGREHLLDYLAYKQKLIAENNMGMTVDSVAGNSYKETLDQLAARGLDPSFLPTCLGGDFDYDNSLDTWMHLQLSLERQMYAELPIPMSIPGPSNHIPETLVVNRACLTFPTFPSGLDGACTVSHHQDAQYVPFNNNINDHHRESPFLLMNATTTSASASTCTASTTQEASSVHHLAKTVLSSSNAKASVVKAGGRSMTAGKKVYTHSTERTKQTLKKLQYQSQTLQGNNEKLRNENRNLEALLCQARFIAALHDVHKTS